jgi:hypothetical protein
LVDVRLTASRPPRLSSALLSHFPVSRPLAGETLNVDPSVVNARAFEVPVKAGVRFHNMVTVSLGGTGTISHVINNTGAAVTSGHQVTSIVSGP